MSLDTSQRSVLDRYTPAILGAVTAIHDPSETGGVGFVTDSTEHRFRLSLKDLMSLHDDLATYLAAHLSRRTHSAGSEAGDSASQTSASSTAASTALESE